MILGSRISAVKRAEKNYSQWGIYKKESRFGETLFVWRDYAIKSLFSIAIHFLELCYTLSSYFTRIAKDPNMQLLNEIREMMYFAKMDELDNYENRQLGMMIQRLANTLWLELIDKRLFRMIWENDVNFVAEWLNMILEENNGYSAIVMQIDQEGFEPLHLEIMAIQNGLWGEIFEMEFLESRQTLLINFKSETPAIKAGKWPTAKSD